MKKRRLLPLGLLLGAVLLLWGSAAAQALSHRHPPFSQEARCVSLSLFVREDRLPEGEAFSLPPLQDGDILVTGCTHTLGWRHGHAALVTDAARGETLEAVTLGTPSAPGSVAAWRRYPQVTVLRLKGGDPAPGREAARLARAELTGVPYRLTSGLLGEKYPSPPAGAQCAYLVWYAYRCLGYDLDSDGGRLVTVDDLMNSPYLEKVNSFTGFA